MSKPKENQMTKKYVKHLNKNELLERMATELVDMHINGYIDLLHWETALEIAERFYFVEAKIDFTKKENTNA
jgi:hypothetical protein